MAYRLFVGISAPSLLVPVILLLAAVLVTVPDALHAGRARAARVETETFGRLPDGRPVSRHRLTNKRGMVVELTDYGAAIASIGIRDRHGGLVETVVSPRELQGFVSSKRRFGAIVGRYAGRLRGAALVDGVRHELSTNASGVTLHGGDPGFDRALWRARPFETPDSVGVVFTHISPDGDQGFPGELRVAARYVLARNANALTLNIEANSSRPTVANLTNHVYFNLAGGGSIACHRLQVDADRRVELDDRKLPTGRLIPTGGAASDFRAARSLGAAIQSSGAAAGIDEMLVLQPAGKAVLSDPASGRSLTISTNQPGLQVFTGNAFDGSDRDRLGRAVEKHGGVALEPGHFPDSPWIAQFPPTRVAPGRPLRWHTRWAFGSGPRLAAANKCE